MTDATDRVKEAMEMAEIHRVDLNNLSPGMGDKTVGAVLAAHVTALTAEVEKLRADNAALQNIHACDMEVVAMLGLARDELTARLAEADKRIRECVSERRGLWDAINPPRGGRCRDCADEDGRCPGSGLLCDPQAAALETIANMRTASARLAVVEGEREALREAGNRLVNTVTDEAEHGPLSDNASEDFCPICAAIEAWTALAAIKEPKP